MAFPYDPLNPLRTINGNYVKTPTSYTWDEQDISQSDAGRTEDGLMHKKRIRRAVKLNLDWKNISLQDASDILKLFENEYLSVNYLDVKQGGYQTKTFYVGDRTAPAYNVKLNVWTVGFNLIER